MKPNCAPSFYVELYNAKTTEKMIFPGYPSAYAAKNAKNILLAKYGDDYIAYVKQKVTEKGS